tara:strand:+ start:40 stop:606 length:567 start_codon:yes stop_codon:yes gene_type:complete
MQEFLPRVYCYVNEFNLSDLSKLRKNINIIYRNYNKIDHLNNLLKLKSFCKKANIKLYLSNNIKLSIKLGLNGVYIPSFNKKLNYCGFYNLPENFRIIGSAHNLNEIRIKNQQGCEDILLSPIFKNDKSEKFLDIVKFNIIKLNTKKNLIALGGINQKNFKRLKSLKLKGFASISWAKKNGLKNIRPF